MKFTFTLLTSLFFAGISFSQVLGIYEFTGTGLCPNQNPAVTLQPTGATFSVMNSVGTTCVVTNNVLNMSGWNPATTIDLTIYNEFAITADNAKLLVLDSLIFASRISSNTSTWYLRSSVDNYATNIATDNNTDVLDTFRVKLPISHAGINAVTFRFYVSSVTDNQRAWRMDDITIKGIVTNSNLSVNNLEENLFAIYPNPGSDFLTIQNSSNQKNTQITILSSEGKIVFEDTNINSVNTSNLQKGIYFVKISNDESSSTMTWFKN